MELTRGGDLKNCALAGAVGGGRSIEVAVAGKDQRRSRVRAVGIIESVYPDELVGDCDLENGTEGVGSSISCSAVEIAVGIFNQSGVRSVAIGAVGLCAKAMNRPELARWADLIDCAVIIGSPFGSCSV